MDHHRALFYPLHMLKGVRVGFGDTFVGQCEVFVCLDFVHFFFLSCKAHRSANWVSIL